MYEAGIVVTSISLEDLDYPGAVQEAVDDAQQAENDSSRYVLEADTYEKDIIPRALGSAARVRLDAEAYRERVTRDALGEASRFEALLTEYEKAPRVTRDRLYIEAIEEIYGASNKVFIDAQGGAGNLLYLPLDQLVRGANQATPGSQSSRSADGQTSDILENPERATDDARERTRRDPR
jgi:membrane protease subunit HflK